MRRTLIVGCASLALLGAGAVPALAQEPVPEPPVANCGFLSALVCQIPVTVGPFNIPVTFPNGIFGPPPVTP